MKTKPVFTMSLNHRDATLVVSAVNQGIDSRLEGFTQSTFNWTDDGKLQCRIATWHELQIMIRRLLESGNENAEDLADGIVHDAYTKWIL